MAEGGEGHPPGDLRERELAAFAAGGANATDIVAAADGEARYALSGWWPRVGAMLLDGILIGVPLVIVAFATHDYTRVYVINANGTASWVDRFHHTWVVAAVYGVYVLALLARAGARNGQTLGDQATRIRVVRNDGRPLDIGTVIVREGFGKALIPGLLIYAAPLLALALGAYLLVDYLLPLVEPQNRAIHDLIARTHVVRLPPVEKYFATEPAP